MGRNLFIKDPDNDEGLRHILKLYANHGLPINTRDNLDNMALAEMLHRYKVQFNIEDNNSSVMVFI